MARRETLTIEPGGRGTTYVRTTGFTVYKHGTYPRSSVLAGMPSRTWMGHFDTVEAARAAFPAATLIAGTTHVPLNLNHLPSDGDF